MDDSKGNYEAITKWREQRIRETAGPPDDPKESDRAGRSRAFVNQAAQWRSAEDLRQYVARVMALAPKGAAVDEWAHEALQAADDLDPAPQQAKRLAKVFEVAGEKQQESSVTSSLARRSLAELHTLAIKAGNPFNQGFRWLHHYAGNGPYATPPLSYMEFANSFNSLSQAAQPGDENDLTIQRAHMYLSLIAEGLDHQPALDDAWREFPATE